MRPESATITRVLAAEAASNFGSMLSRLAIAWVATLMLGATAWQMGLLVIADVVAAAFGAVLLGTWVERRNKRRVMLAADALRALLLAAVALAAWRGWLTMSALLLAAAAGGLFTVAFEMARSAWMAQRIAADQLTTRNAQLSAATSLSETAAFALGGWLYQWAGAVVALLVDAFSYLVSAIFLRGIGDGPRPPPVAPSPNPWQAYWHDAREGLATLARHRQLRVLAGIEALRAMAMSVAGASYMIFVARDIGFGEGLIGTVAALGGLGSLLGAAMAPALGRRIGLARSITVGLALGAIGTGCVAAIPAATWLGLGLMAAQQLVGDAGMTLQDIHDRTLRQTAVDAQWLVRVDAGIRSVGQLATLAGALAGGTIGSALDARAALIVSAMLLALAALVSMSSGLKPAPPRRQAPPPPAPAGSLPPS